MRKFLLWFVLVFSISVCIDERSYAFDNKVSSIKDALERLFCFESYWEWADHRIGSALPMRIKIDDKTFHIWINDLAVNEREHTAGYFSGIFQNGDAAIIKHEAYNSKLTPPLLGYLKNKKLFDSKDVMEDILTLPNDCTPHYDPTTPQKDRMLRTVVSTMQKKLSEFAKMGIAKYPKEVVLIIADFNVDYPSTYVLVEKTREVYSVTLHDPQNYDSDEYELETKKRGQVYLVNISVLRLCYS